MKHLRNLIPAVLVLLLAACAIAIFWTAAPPAARPAPAKPIDAAPSVDQHLLQAARQLASFADTVDEQDQAREAMHLADQEVDQAFATALRLAAAAGPPANGPLRDQADRIDRLKVHLAADKLRIAQLTTDSAASPSAADQLELAQAQLALDQDEIEDAQQDLARQGGDPRAKLERALDQHQSAQQQAIAFPKWAGENGGTLSQQAAAWLSLRTKRDRLQAASREATQAAARLLVQHRTLERQLTDGPQASVSDSKAVVARLHWLSGQRKSLMEFDRRAQDARQLAAVYQIWSGLVDGRMRVALHGALGSVALILAILLAMALADRAVLKAFHQADRKRLHQLRLIATVAVQFSAAILILLIVFGPPTQVTTFLGLATAGLTVVLKDYIVSFFGWFALMGKSGVRVGDWVEIEGVSGEVIEIGLLKTVLLEMGNWTDNGHPTGRRVAFANSYALEHHYFNFSTAGQWLWDELQVTVPGGGNPYDVAEEIRLAVERETAADATEAEHDWERVTHQYGVRAFSAKPAVDLRPGLAGLDVKVRYITRAHQRSSVKSRLFQSIVGLLRQPAAAEEPK